MRAASCAAAVVACCLLLQALPCAQAIIEYSRVTRDDRSVIPVAQPFAFGSKGHITLQLKGITLYRRHDQVDEDYSLRNLGFIFSSGATQAKLQEYLSERKCPLQDEELKIFTFDNRQAQAVLTGEQDKVQYDIDVDHGSLTNILFINCESGMPVSFVMKVEQYNVVGADKHKDYLSVGESELDAMYWVVFSLFSVITGAWLVTLLRSEKQHVQHIHWLMLALAVLKTLTVFGQAIMYYVIEHEGTPRGWNWVYYTFTAMRGLLFFAVVILIGTGWSFMSSHLLIDERTRQVLLLVIPLQVLANLAIIITSEESPAFNAWLTWKDIFHMVDIICCCAVLFPIVWSIKRLKEESEYDGKAARNLVRMQQVREFYVLVVAFIWVTRIGVFLLESLVDYRFKWTVAAINELAVLTFYVVVGTKFRPSESNPYLRITSQDGSAPV